MFTEMNTLKLRINEHVEGRVFLWNNCDYTCIKSYKSSGESERSFDISYGAPKTYVHEVLKMLENGGFSYEILDEIDYFTPKQTSYNPDELLPREEIEKREVQLLPEKIRKLYPCLF